jgi:hypothetical protein
VPTTGDYPGTVETLLAAGAPTRHTPPTGEDAIDALLAAASTGDDAPTA